MCKQLFGRITEYDHLSVSTVKKLFIKYTIIIKVKKLNFFKTLYGYYYMLIIILKIIHINYNFNVYSKISYLIKTIIN